MLADHRLLLVDSIHKVHNNHQMMLIPSLSLTNGANSLEGSLSVSSLVNAAEINDHFL